MESNNSYLECFFIAQSEMFSREHDMTLTAFYSVIYGQSYVIQTINSIELQASLGSIIRNFKVLDQ